MRKFESETIGYIKEDNMQYQVTESIKISIVIETNSQLKKQKIRLDEHDKKTAQKFEQLEKLIQDQSSEIQTLK